MNDTEIIESLRVARLLLSPEPVVTPLTGGVSSEIVRIDDGARQFVVKRALSKLKVRDDWFADVSRNSTEESYLRKVGQIVPGSVPQIVFSNPSSGWFAMEFLGGEFRNWKELLMDGHAHTKHARQAGEILGQIHRETWDDPDAAREFATLENFRQLRLEPYLETTATRVPELASFLRAEKDRLAQTNLSLVHGDFSPKNILVSPQRMVLVDAEVGWFGDPVFDTAFLLNHFHLKALVHSATPDQILAMAPKFWASYTETLGSHADSKLEQRTVRLVLCLMLARIHGKSPVEYLTETTQRDFVSTFVKQHLPDPPSSLSQLTAAWRKGLNHI